MALTKYNFNSFDVTSAASTALGFNANANGFATISPGSMTLIKTLTASSSGDLSFVNGSSDVVLDSTYPVYLFKFINLHPGTDGVKLRFNVSTDAGSNYNLTKTTTMFHAQHDEGDSFASLSYAANDDLAQGTGVAQLQASAVGNGNDESLSGEFYLFNPSSTTFVKHFMARVNYYYESGGASMEDYTSGYVNSTSDVDAIQFTFNSGNIDAGTIKLYGIKDS